MYTLVCYDHDSPEETKLFFFKNLSSAYSKLQSLSNDIDYRDLSVDRLYEGYPYSYEIKEITFDSEDDDE